MEHSSFAGISGGFGGAAQGEPMRKGAGRGKGGNRSKGEGAAAAKGGSGAGRGKGSGVGLRAQKQSDILRELQKMQESEDHCSIGWDYS